MASDSMWHVDSFGRAVKIRKEDFAQEMYLSPVDGRLVRLVVQGTSHGSFSPGGTEASGTWERSGPAIMKVSSVLRLVYWTYSSMIGLKWIPSCLLILVMLLWPQNLEGTLKNGGYYDRVYAFDRQYPMVARNQRENRNQDQVGEVDEREAGDEEARQPLLYNGDDIEMTSIAPPVASMSAAAAINHRSDPTDVEEDYDDLLPRHFGPRWLCFLQYNTAGDVIGHETRLVADWVQEHGDNADTDFVFLSYTRRQFCVATPQELIAPLDRETLIQYGIEAARSAGKSAFWLDYECIRDADGLSKATSQSTDVYRICDIVRAAHSLVILVGPPLQSKYSPATIEPYSPDAMLRWLQEWGTRLWTLPEILLISSEKRVKIYAIDGPWPPLEWSKRHFASRSVWRDAKLVRQLLDHYESSIHLKPLELISIALDCFSRRHTDQFNQGDIVYALMGLLRRRPAVNKSDTSFIAFARLSLANDTEALLERLICLQPLRSGLPWHDQGDFWAAKLWDVEPRCQVAGIVDDETVILDGAHGATIQWDSMEQIYFFKRPTMSRTITKVLLRGSPLYLMIGLAMTIAGALVNPQATLLELLIPGIIILIPTAIIALASPSIILDIYSGKFWSTQALFVGIEGVPSTLGYVEERLFGSAAGRLKWSPAGSQLSKHEHSAADECVGLPPPTQDDHQELGHDNDGAPRMTTFTLVDTYSMTALAFQAERPPTTVIICGQEGGMQRAALCSYDWKRNTFAREQVVRLKTTVLDRMLRMDRFRFSLNRRCEWLGDPDVLQNSSPQEPRLKPDGSHKGVGVFGRWTVDVVLIPCMFLASYRVLSD
ncbi:uncharacterized protein PG998_004644 [Apiospora kogelbergensis]|uniref:uncharacterized protein n=1 Tax=Apiospora kogelbergensis TaxID=1337665 RepID=UPI00312F2355